MAESLLDKKLRLMLEGKCREMAEQIAKGTPAGSGFALFMFDFGAGGSVAYVSNGERRDILRLMREWIARQESAS